MEKSDKPASTLNPFFVGILSPFFVVIGFIGIVFIIVSNSFFYSRSGSQDNSAGDTAHKYEVNSPAIPSNMDFCGERVPLENFYVKERLDRELIVNTYYHSATILALKRANRWFPVIEPILKKNGIPDDFKYLSVIESNLDNVVSPADAVGFWQFTKPSAERYGLEVNDAVDERYNVEKSTEAACQYLLFAYNRFHSWTLAAASYNIGIAGVDKQIERQRMKNYYNLLFGEETSRYISRILAIKTIFKDSKKYGYYLNEEDFYPPFDTENLKIDYRINDLADFAIKHGINYKILKIYNPWLRDNYLALKKGRTYQLKVPKNGSARIVSEFNNG